MLSVTWLYSWKSHSVLEYCNSIFIEYLTACNSVHKARLLTCIGFWMQEVTEAAPVSQGPDALIRTKMQKKRHREGYEEGVTVMHRPAPVAAFLAAKDPVSMLGQYSRYILFPLTFSSPCTSMLQSDNLPLSHPSHGPCQYAWPVLQVGASTHPVLTASSPCINMLCSHAFSLSCPSHRSCQSFCRRQTSKS